MKYRMLTVDREFGSGGGLIAETIAGWLGWKLIDRSIIDAIAYSAHVDCKTVRKYDEHVGGWLQRLNQSAMRATALAAGFELGDNAVFDSEQLVKVTQKVVEGAYEEGNCVVVGRGAQCILHGKPDVFHAFVYAPLHTRIARLRKRLGPDIDVEQRLRATDSTRARYIQQYYGMNAYNFQLYDLMLSSRRDEIRAARTIVAAMDAEILHPEVRFGVPEHES